MEKILIITDSASDMPEELEEKYGICILPFTIVIGDQSYVSREDFNAAGFYDLMAEHDEIPKTSQITPFEFQELFEAKAKEGYTDLILVLINGKGSATYGNALMAKEAFFEDCAEFVGKMNIYCFDGMGYSAQYGVPAVNAAKMVQDGKSAKEVVDYLTEDLPRRKVYFGMNTLKYAGKSGRIPSAAAFVGDKLNLKPIMKIYHQVLDTAAKVRGSQKMIPKIVELTLQDMEPGTPYELICGNDQEMIDTTEKLMTEAVGYGSTFHYEIGAAVAANAGPQTVGISFRVKDSFEQENYTHG